MDAVEVVAAVEGERPSSRLASVARFRWPAVFAALWALLLATRFAGFNQSLWEDEISTIRNYIEPGPVGSFGHYGTNDHILFSLLSWLTVNLPRLPDSAYRLWAIVPFMAAVALIATWLCRRADRVVALFFVFLATASPLLLILSTEARGYGLTFLAMAVLVIAGYEAAADGRLRWLSLFAAAGVIGTWTLPTFVVPFAGSAAALFAVQRVRRSELLRRLAVSGLAIGVYYAVPAGALWHSRSQHFGTRLPWHAPVTGPVSEFIAAFIPLINMDGPGFQAALIAATAPVLVLGFVTARRRMPTVAAVTVAPVVATYLALTGGRFFVEPRFVSYLLVPLFVFAAFGLKSLLTSARLGAALYGGTLLMIVAALGWAAAKNERVPIQANREAARAVVDALRQEPALVVLNVVHPGDVRYYLPPAVSVASFAPTKLQRLVCSPRRSRRLVLVQQPTEGVQLVKTGCLNGHIASRQVFSQRSYGGRIAVWTIGAVSGSS